MTKRTLCLLIGSAILFLVGFYFLKNYNTILPPPDKRNASDITSALKVTHPELFTKDSKPIFNVVKISRVQPQWYIITIKATSQKSIETRLVLFDQHFKATDMLSYAGPQSRFSSDELVKTDIPDKVQTELLR